MRSVRRRTTRALAFLCALASLAVPARHVFAAPSAGAIAMSDEALTVFAGGEPLTALERRRIAAKVDNGLRTDPAQFERADAAVRRLLAKADALDPRYADGVREELRLRFAMAPTSLLERSIVEKHDPTVVFDSAHERLITARTLVVLEHASRWLAQELHVPGPAADFVADERARLQADFARMPLERQDAYVHIARYYPAGVDLFKSWSSQRRNAWIADARAAIHGPIRLEAFTAVAMARGYAAAHEPEDSHPSAAMMLQMQNMNNLVMGLQAGMRSQTFAPTLISPGF